MAEEKCKHNNYALTATGIVMTVIAVVAGMAAIIRPMNQQNDNLQTQITELKGELNRQTAGLKTDLKDHQLLNNHPWGVLAQMAEVKEKFTEVETQFKGLRERGDLLTERVDFRLAELEKWRDWWYKEIAIKTNNSKSKPGVD